MDALLTDRWLAGTAARSIVDDASVSNARDDVRALAAPLGFDDPRLGELAIIVSELASNQLRHARLGRIGLCAIERDGVRGVEIVAADRGVGIADPAAAIRGAPRSSGSLGIGISSVLRMADEVDFDVRMREGTCVRARKFVAPVGRRREVAILGRPIDGESSNGDDGWFARHGGRLVLSLADGLGHGSEARRASTAAIDVARGSASGPTELCAEAAVAAKGTRGAVLAVADIDEPSRTVSVAGGGNIMVHLIGPRGTTAMSTPSLVVGVNAATFRTETRELAAHDTVVLFTDGVSARARLDIRDPVMHGHSLVVAAHLIAAFGRSTDDVMVIVAR